MRAGSSMLSRPICAAIPWDWSGPGRELGRRAPLEVDGERDPERDDQDEQDVREREDQPGSDLRGRLLRLGVRTEPEAHAPDRRDVRRMRRVILDLLAEPGDVHVER